MSTAQLARIVDAAAPGRARADEPLARHTSFRIGGPADVLVEPGSADELARVVRAAAEPRQPLTVLGISARKADQVWAYARAWLREELTDDVGESDRR